MLSKRYPFYSHAHGDFVVGEVCECGHLESEHGSKLRPLHHGSDVIVRHPHDGNCCLGDCPCGRYTFARHVTVDECARLFRRKRGRSVRQKV